MMAAQYLVRFEDGSYFYLSSADAKTMSKRDVRMALTKARQKARIKLRKQKGLPASARLPKIIDARCVG